MTRSWLGVADDDPYGIDNLPFGTARWPDGSVGLAARIGEFALDVGALGLFATFDALLAAGRPAWTQVRTDVDEWLTDERFRSAVEPHLHPLDDVQMQLPFTVADYVDFYASEAHATNVGRLFRPDGDALPPNWKHLPIGYHGRAGTVVVSGADVRRPAGQTRDGTDVTFGPSRRLDFEAEVAFVVGTPSPTGSSIAVDDFAEHVFGICLLNDWSARDIQAWEYVPLGPFLGKSFATSISAWVTPLAALTAAWVRPPQRDPQPLPYLADSAAPAGLDLELTVRLNGTVVSRPPFAAMYWTLPQLLAHLTSNGASARTGDLVASGTVSGAGADQLGCLLEITRAGGEPLTLDDGSVRTFLEDGDEVLITATAPGSSTRIALGEVRGRIVPS
ncbi:MAG TPA: fumarylacetoacetase [Jatrophihabitantaceae bacterium]|nr:fumarylacetoacetase [Jatrophihabitantaceae bacterium]